jgi:hypothetical protein
MNEYIEILVNGFTYGGELLHIVINYALIFICLIPYFKMKVQWKKEFRKYWISILSIMLTLQIYLWFAENVTGVSLIWSALAGLNIVILLRINRLPDEGMTLIIKLLWISLLCVLVADIYYWFIYPAITTIAHLVATFTGIVIYSIVKLISMKTGDSLTKN